jgi:5-methylcytosine-specific restriction enzyme A
MTFNIFLLALIAVVVYRMTRTRNSRNQWWVEYSRYLRSPEWAYRRKRILERDRYQCRLRYRGCTHRATQVHHLRYTKRMGGESDRDLIAVCVSCHDRETARNRANRRGR